MHSKYCSRRRRGFSLSRCLCLSLSDSSSKLYRVSKSWLQISAPRARHTHTHTALVTCHRHVVSTGTRHSAPRGGWAASLGASGGAPATAAAPCGAAAAATAARPREASCRTSPSRGVGRRAPCGRVGGGGGSVRCRRSADGHQNCSSVLKSGSTLRIPATFASHGCGEKWATLLTTTRWLRANGRHMARAHRHCMLFDAPRRAPTGDSRGAHHSSTSDAQVDGRDAGRPRAGRGVVGPGRGG